MALSTWLPMATRTGLAFSGQADLADFPNASRARIVLVPAAGEMADNSVAVAIAIESWDGSTMGDDQLPLWKHVAGTPWIGGGTVSPRGRAISASVDAPRPRYVRGRIVVTGSVRFRIDGEVT